VRKLKVTIFNRKKGAGLKDPRKRKVFVRESSLESPGPLLKGTFFIDLNSGQIRTLWQAGVGKGKRTERKTDKENLFKERARLRLWHHGLYTFFLVGGKGNGKAKRKKTAGEKRGEKK